MAQINYGTYGRQHEVDEEGKEIGHKIPQVKRKTRGRPRKDEVSEGNRFYVNEWLYAIYFVLSREKVKLC